MRYEQYFSSALCYDCVYDTIIIGTEIRPNVDWKSDDMVSLV